MRFTTVESKAENRTKQLEEIAQRDCMLREPC